MFRDTPTSSNRNFQTKKLCFYESPLNTGHKNLEISRFFTLHTQNDTYSETFSDWFDFNNHENTPKEWTQNV